MDWVLYDRDLLHERVKRCQLTMKSTVQWVSGLGNITMDWIIHPFLHGNCRQQIICTLFDLEIFYSLPYERNILHYNHVNIDLNKKAIDNFDWKKFLEGCYPNNTQKFLTDNVLNIMSNFIPNKNILSMIEIHLTLTRRSKV